MKAIVLTYDRNAILTEHMIRCYEDLWPDHPFVFRIPFQNFERCIPANNREYVKSPPEIKATVLLLLAGCEDEEWVYWCIDDKYPIKLELNNIKLVHNSIFTDKTEGIAGILFCRARKMLDPEYLTDATIIADGVQLLERKSYHQIWIHQFVKVKVLRHLFLSFPKIVKAKMMDDLKFQVQKPVSHRLFVTSINYAIFGESSSDGQITLNCSKSMAEKGIEIPKWFEVNNKRTTIIGML